MRFNQITIHSNWTFETERIPGHVAQTAANELWTFLQFVDR